MWLRDLSRGRWRNVIAIVLPPPLVIHLADVAEQLGLQDVLSLLVLLRALISFVILPAHCLLTLLAIDVAHDMPACRHRSFRGIALLNVDHAVEEVCFAMLATEILERERVIVRYI